MRISGNNSALWLLSFLFALFLLGGCGTTMSVYDTSTCTVRGGKLVYQCIRWNSNGSCNTNQQVCSGGMTHDTYEKQQQRKSSGISPAPLPVLSEEEKAAKKLESWKKRLRRLTGKNSLTRNADKFPKFTWLAATWCLKGSDSKIPVNFYRVGQNGLKRLEITYVDYVDPYHALFFGHAEIIGNYFDLFLTTWSHGGKRKEGGRRLEKISDEEFALVYRYDEYHKLSRSRPDDGRKYLRAEALKIGPDKHFKNPEVYVKCE